MAADANPTDRYASLQERIDAARQRLAENNKMEWAEIGNILEGISDELDEAGDHDHDTRQKTYDRLDQHLDDIHAKLDSGRPAG